MTGREDSFVLEWEDSPWCVGKPVLCFILFQMNKMDESDTHIYCSHGTFNECIFLIVLWKQKLLNNYTLSDLTVNHSNESKPGWCITQRIVGERSVWTQS